ncbi:oligoribonuclease [Oceanobacillus piezotolerans]|uniref:Oligoribonuclease n=1 Tax=Oceanobacillus piezotolerans TaxID=2448030 RepID=A0A498D9T2_9BACI|nr:oligoribonuclease [Oceanobacillus piezotolerans]RLL47721.1 oligoribonuclease [Oceanobacillus piezotolerans]
MFKLLSHNDLDGVGCGILAKLAFGNDVKVRYNSIGSLNREVEFFLDNEGRDTFLIITDLSVNEENEKRLEDYYQAGGKVQLIDHHQTALRYNEYEWGHVVVEDKEGNLTSATSLLYQYLTEKDWLKPSTALEEFVELIRQYDTWEWEKNENEKAQHLNTLFYLISIDEFEEKMIERLKHDEHFTFDSFEEKILVMEDDKIERYIRRKRRELVQKKVGNYYAGVVFAESYHSELGNQLGKEYPHLDYIAILNMGGRRMGFRTIHDEVDVSEVASHFGGGGHKKASGCTMNDEAYQLFVAETFHLDPIREDAKRNRYNLKASSFGTLYQNRLDQFFLLYTENEMDWFIEKENQLLVEKFPSFEEAERFLKRHYEAWLTRDEQFVSFLMERARNRNV